MRNYEYEILSGINEILIGKCIDFFKIGKCDEESLFSATGFSGNFNPKKDNYLIISDINHSGNLRIYITVSDMALSENGNLFIIGNCENYAHVELLSEIKLLTNFNYGSERPWMNSYKNREFTYLECCYFIRGLDENISGNFTVDNKFIYNKNSLFSEIGYAFRGRLGYMGRDFHGLRDCLSYGLKTCTLKWNYKEISHIFSGKEKEDFDLTIDYIKDIIII